MRLLGRDMMEMAEERKRGRKGQLKGARLKDL